MLATPKPTQAHLDEAIRRIVEAVDPERIVVFGSFARGEACPGSDLDLLVVVRHVDHHLRAAGRLNALLSGLGIPKDVVVATEHDVAGSIPWHDSVLKTAHTEGRTAYLRR